MKKKEKETFSYRIFVHKKKMQAGLKTRKMGNLMVFGNTHRQLVLKDAFCFRQSNDDLPYFTVLI